MPPAASLITHCPPSTTRPPAYLQRTHSFECSNTAKKANSVKKMANQIEKLEAARSAYLWLSLVIFGYIWLPLVTFEPFLPFLA